MKKIMILIMILIVFLTACSNQKMDTELDQGNEDEIIIEDELNPESIEDNVGDTNEIGGFDEEIDLSKYSIQLTLEKLENSVKLVWTKPSEEFEFVSYKISRSVTDSNPVYPGNTLRKTIANIDETEYLDNLPEEGISYYVVTAIGPLNEKIHSNPVVVEFPNTKETQDQDIKLTAISTDNGVLLNWNKYEGDFLFYKLVWTTDHKFPKYPDDSTISTIAYVNETEYLHLRPETGMNYYAVTVVRPNKSRFTSERASVNIG